MSQLKLYFQLVTFQNVEVLTDIYSASSGSMAYIGNISSCYGELLCYPKFYLKTWRMMLLLQK